MFFQGRRGGAPAGYGAEPRGGAPAPPFPLVFHFRLAFRRPAPVPDAVPSVALSTPPCSSIGSLPPSPRESLPPRRGLAASNSPGSERCAPPASVVSAPG